MFRNANGQVQELDFTADTRNDVAIEIVFEAF